ncbi:dTDP-4-dehydrorhamnose reductase [Stenotrophomonas bentonitica]|uniref:dTDP-4-dehydrorhamnose reductase n=1 Tax=Stenotrophomonas bentonitica TaxID=1450134 RepID=UPI00345E600F
MKVLLFAANGQLGQELRQQLSALGQLVLTTRSGVLGDGTHCEAADLDQPDTLCALLDRVRPDLVVNAAAYTAVDRAEGNADSAWRVNAEAPGVIARWCSAARIPMVHYSTDYVFNGNCFRPYREDDPTDPISVYGASKAAGEVAVRSAGGRHLIFRTAWVYSSHSKNFLRTMLRLGAERTFLRVVADQHGTPTSAAMIAEVTAQALRHPGNLSGTWHLTAQGSTSWHGFAEAIFTMAVERGLLVHPPVVQPIESTEYPTPARRPMNSCLNVSKLQSDFGIALPHWEIGLARVLDQLAG